MGYGKDENSIIEVTFNGDSDPQLRQDLNDVETQLAQIATVIKKDPAITDDAPIINSAIATGGNFLLEGAFVIKSAIRIKDNTTITFTHGSSITLANGANSYVFRNDDFVNGNKNITIQNFNLYGNGQNQLRDLSFGAAEGYGGFGMMFYLVDGLKILDGYVDKTNAWGIAHFSCNNFEFRRIRFMQYLNLLDNSDGITGSSSNGIIEDISGWTGDDMVAITSASGGLGGGSNGGQGGAVGLPDVPVSNVIVRNIYPGKNGIEHTPQAVAIYSRNSMPVTNVSVENVKGHVRTRLVYIVNYWSESPDGIFNNITINGLEAYYDNETYDPYAVQIGLGIFDNLTISNVKKDGLPVHYSELILIDSAAKINNLVLDNIMYKNNHPTNGTFCLNIRSNLAEVTSVFANNCRMEGNENSSVIYKVGESTHLTTVYGQNLQSSGYAIDGFGTNVNLAVQAPGCTARISKITPIAGNMVIDKDKNIIGAYTHGYYDYKTIPITLQNGWVEYGGSYASPVIYKVGNMAYLRGMIKLGVTTDGTAIGNFPVSLCPFPFLIFPVATSGGHGNIVIRTDGVIYVSTGGLPANDFVSLDGISFPIGNSLS